MPEDALNQGPVSGIWPPLGRGQKILIWFLFWTTVAIFSAINYYYLRWVADISMPLTFPQTVMTKTILWYFFGLLTLIIVRIGRAIPFQRTTWWTWFAKHLAISSVIVFAYTLLYTLTVMPFYGARISAVSIPPWFYDIARMHLSYYFLAYWLIIGGDHALEYYRKVRERDKQLSQARLTLLRSQLQPHFLFNSMHMILSLIETDPHAAKDMLEKLSDLLRMSITNMEQHETRLSTELDFTRLYLDLQKRRFHDRLSVSIHVPEELHEARVPFLLLQPLVENAIKHGVSSQADTVSVEINVESTESELHLSVVDSGAGLTEQDAHSRKAGIGLSNLRQRLTNLYGTHQQITMSQIDAGGARVDIRIPLVWSK